MDFASLLVSILVAGAIGQTKVPFNFYRLHRYDGQLLHLKVLTSGVFYFSLAATLCLLLNAWQPQLLDLNFNLFLLAEHLLTKAKLDHEAVLQGSWIVCLSVATFFVALSHVLWVRCLFPLWLKKIRKLCKSSIDDDSYRLTIYQRIIRDSTLDNMCFESFLYNKPLLFSLKERKAYVGIIQTMGEPTEKNSANQEIVIFPILSGYRDSNTLEVRFTTAYDIPTESKPAIALCIKTEQISSISYFDFDVYESTRLQRNTPSSLGVT